MAFVVCFNFSTISPPPQGACGNVRLGGRISRQSFRVFGRAGFSDVVICREIGGGAFSRCFSGPVRGVNRSLMGACLLFWRLRLRGFMVWGWA